jgi:hypothetical protein
MRSDRHSVGVKNGPKIHLLWLPGNHHPGSFVRAGSPVLSFPAANSASLKLMIQEEAICQKWSHKWPAYLIGALILWNVYHSLTTPPTEVINDNSAPYDEVYSQ